MILALAAAAYNPDDVKPGWVALGLVVLLGLATFLLWRSMNTQLKRINVPTEDEADEAGADPEGAGSVDQGDPAVVDSTPSDADPWVEDPGEPRRGPDPGPRP